MRMGGLVTEIGTLHEQQITPRKDYGNEFSLCVAGGSASDVCLVGLPIHIRIALTFRWLGIGCRVRGMGLVEFGELMMKALFVLIALLVLTACTDAGIGKITSLGGSASVDCWSGGKLIYSGESTGKVISEQNSDGYFFRDKNTDEFMEVSGNCVINYH